MRLFNLDLHISVIADLKNIFSEMGHTVDDVCLSDHAFVMGKKKKEFPLINSSTWWGLNKQTCDQFYNDYKDQLESYDAFICTYPPAFALLYEKFNKPIIVDVPIRMEAPFLRDKQILDYFIGFLKSGIDNKQIIPIANNKYDKAYCERYTDREWTHIPSLCKYTGIDCNPSGDYLIYSKTKFHIDGNIKRKEDVLPTPYKWTDLNSVSGIVHVPYNISTMSIFEQYTGNIPLLFPTPDYLGWLKSHNVALQELSWDIIPQIELDWKKTADFYDTEWMQNITYFDDLTGIDRLINTINPKDISDRMRIENISREKRIKDLWKGVFDGYI